MFRSERSGVREMSPLKQHGEEHKVLQCGWVADQQGGCCQGYASQPLQQGVPLWQVP